MINFDINALHTPYYIIDEKLLVKNLEILKQIMNKADCNILLAQKAFSMFYLYALIGKYLSGTVASGLFEAKLGFYEMGKETHIFSPAYLENEFDEILEICDHITFNSFTQWEKYKTKALSSNKKFGLRINPEHSTQEHSIYDPCSLGSRLGITIKNFRPDLLEGITGLHFHTLCQQNSDALVETLEVVEDKFKDYIKGMEWINFGGGHHLTRSNYDIETLISTIKTFKEKYKVKVYLEPGEAIVLNSGYLVSTVLDIVNNGMEIAILDTSATCHMPDVLEMPYRPHIIDSGKPNEKTFTYRLSSYTCLAGDIIGDYSFDKPLKIGDKLIFCDMAQYSMVKNNMFNGVNLPSIAVVDSNNNIKLIRKFGYEDFKGRLS